MERILKYLQQIFDENAQIHKWNAKDILSLKLAGSYDFFLVALLEEEFLLVRPYEQQAIPNLKIQIRLIEEKTGYQVALLLEEITSYRMKKMLEERMAFLVLDRQMYLPFMALHIKAQKRGKRTQNVRVKFTPATQLIYLTILYENKNEFCIEELSEKLKLSDMTVVRGMEELKQIGIVDYVVGGQTGRKKIFTRIPLKQYYQIGKEYLINPVKKEFYVREIPKHLKVYKSGLTALCEQTMLGEPRQTVYAIGSAQEKDWKELEVSKEQAIEENFPCLQVVKYDIGILTDNEYVDPITLILSLPEKDDRIEIAVDELMEDKQWFMV